MKQYGFRHQDGRYLEQSGFAVWEGKVMTRWTSDINRAHKEHSLATLQRLYNTYPELQVASIVQFQWVTLPIND